MKKSAELRKQAAEKVKAAGELLSTAGDAGLSDEQKVAFDALHADAKRLNDQADILDQQEKAEAAFSQSTGGPPAGANVPVTVKEQFENDPKRGFKSAREFFATVRNAALGAGAPPNLRSLAAPLAKFAVGSDEHSGADNAHGGFLIPESFINNPLMTATDDDPTVGRTAAIPMATPIVKIPAIVDKDHSSSVSGGLTVAWRAETTLLTASRMNMEQIQLEANELVGLTYASDELITDAATSLIALIDIQFRKQFASKLLQSKLRGTGAGQMLGVLNSPAKVAVAKETNQPADTIVYANIVKMAARAYQYGQRFMWMANPDAMPQLRSLTNPAGTLIWGDGTANSGAPASLLGVPIYFNEHLETVGDEGDLILVDWSQFIEATYQPLQSAESMHVRFEYNERAFKFWQRSAGAPWWRSALTPAKGSNTLSPIVTLAARA